MTEAEVLALINAAIVANGNNEITANVLRPILVAMLEQPNDKVGELVDLDTTDKTNIVNAINEILNTASTTFEIHSGSNNPNITPPASYSIGDWYIRNGSSLYQYNGDSWVLISNSSTISDTESFLATEGQTVFNLSTSPVNVDVWVNDVYQQLTYAYTFSGNTVTLNDPITAGDRVAIRKYEQNISGATQKTPIQGTYDDLADLILNQASQLEGYIYEVTDASGFTGIDSGKLWVRYLGTTLGTEADYSWQPKTGATFLEEEIFGTATENLTTTGAVNLDISAFSSHKAVLTGNTVHTLTGLPSSGKTVAKTLYVTSTTTQTYSIANATKTVGSYVNDGSMNRVTIEVANFPSGNIITVTYENLI